MTGVTVRAPGRPAAPALAHRRWRPRPVAVTVVLAGILASVAVLAVGVGAVPLAPSTVVGVIVDRLAGTPRSGIDDEIVWGLRLPRVLLAAVVGAGLAAAGTVLQAVVRNPLADPYIMGVSAGASLGAVLVLTAGGTGVLAGLGVSGAAFVGALVTLALVVVLGRRAGAVDPTRLVLAGVAIGYLLTAVTSFIQLRAAPTELSAVLYWLLGSVSGARWADLGVPAAAVVVVTVVLLLHHRQLNAMLLGDESAQAVGLDVRRLRLGLLVLASLLTGVVVAVAGGVGFVGLVVPHAVRLVLGADHRLVLPAAVLSGAILLVLVDLVARTVSAPSEIPLGIVTALLGAPFFLWLLRRRTGPGAA